MATALHAAGEDLLADFSQEQGAAWMKPAVRKEAGLGDLFEEVPCTCDNDGWRQLQATGLCTDSRRVEEGDVFFCVRGDQDDGHDFVQEAADRGAVAIVALEDTTLPEGTGDVAVVRVSCEMQAALRKAADVFYGNPSSKMSVVAVTGTNGKTTTTWLVRGILEEQWVDAPVGMIGTVEYALAEVRLDDEGRAWEPREADPTADLPHAAPGYALPYAAGARYEVPNTTPDVLVLRKLMSSMADQGCVAAVMEASSHALDQGRCEGTDVKCAVFTNLSRDHLDYHGDMDAYLQAKLKLFESLSEGAAAVVNADDPAAEHFISAANTRRARLVTFSCDPSSSADVVATGVDLSLFKTDIACLIRGGLDGQEEEKGEEVLISTPLLGRANVYNVLAAVATGVALGVDTDVIVPGIESTEFVPGRYELINNGQDFGVVVDYAHTPDALARLVEDVRAMGAQRVITVVGCGGDRDRGKRPLMGKIAHDMSDIVFITSDNPRTENPDIVIDDVVLGFSAELYDQFPVDKDLGLHWLQDIHNLDPTFVPETTTRRWEKYKYVGSRSRAQHLQNSVRRYVVRERYYAIRLAVAMAQPGDAVLVAGKGHEDYQVVAGADHRALKSWFDDRVECFAALGEMAKIQQAGWDTSELPWKWGHSAPRPPVGGDPDDILDGQE